jgi:hypothetical protein
MSASSSTGGSPQSVSEASTEPPLALFAALWSAPPMRWWTLLGLEDLVDSSHGGVVLEHHGLTIAELAVKILKTDSDDSVRGTAARLLSGFVARVAWVEQTLIDALGQDPSPYVQCDAAASLAKAKPTPSIVEALGRAMYRNGLCVRDDHCGACVSHAARNALRAIIAADEEGQLNLLLAVAASKGLLQLEDVLVESLQERYPP